MINYDTPGMAFPRLAKPPTPPIGRDNIHSMNHYHNNLNNLPGLGASHPRDRHSPGVSPIAHAIAAQILNNHLNHPAAGITAAAQNGLLAGQQAGQQALVNNLTGLGSGYQPSSLASVPVGYQPPTSPFSRF